MTDSIQNAVNQKALLAVIQLYVKACRANFDDRDSRVDVHQCVSVLGAVFENDESIILTDQHFEELILPMTLLTSDTLNPVETLTSHIVLTALMHPACPPYVLSQVCRTTANRSSYPVQVYVEAATKNVNCSEEDRVYAVLAKKPLPQ